MSEQTETWCPQCGRGVAVDEDGCCACCGADAVGPGVEAMEATLASLRLRTERAEANERELAEMLSALDPLRPGWEFRWRRADWGRYNAAGQWVAVVHASGWWEAAVGDINVTGHASGPIAAMAEVEAALAAGGGG